MVTLIVSDIHLGSKHSQSVLASTLLGMSFDRLILNGDTINSLNFNKFAPIHWAVLGQLRDIARKRELILIRGNHDVPYRLEGHTFGPQDFLANLIGVDTQEEYSLEINGRSYLVLHGDRFDPTLNWPIVTDVAAWCYRATGKIHKKSAKWLRDRGKELGGVVPLVKRGAVEYARDRGHHGVIVGHTHYPDDERIDGIHYLNGGQPIDPLGLGLVGARGAVLFLLGVFGTLAGLLVTYLIVSRSLKHRAGIDRLLLRIPVLGSCLEALALGRFALATRLTLDTSLPTHEAIKLGLRASGNAAYAEAVDRIGRSVRKGGDVAVALTKAGLFPEDFVNIVATAEEGGRLPEVMKHQAKYYEEESERRLLLLTRAAGFTVWLVVAGLIIFAIFQIFTRVYLAPINQMVG